MAARLRQSIEERDKGFTLIELLVVIIIIGILAAIAIPVFLNQRKKGVDASIKSDLRAMAALQETYIADNPTLQGLAWDGAAALPAGIADFKKSGSNTIVVTVEVGTGYCVKGSNTGATAAGGATGTFYWYDSALGGLQTAASAAAPAAAGACS